MINRFKTYIQSGFSYSAIELVSSEKEEFFFLEVSRGKDDIAIKKEKEFTGFKNLENELIKNSPLYLVYNTESVLTKVVDVDNLNKGNTETLIQKTFPNLNLNNFYYQVVFQAKRALVSIVKKDSVDEVINSLKSMKINLAGFSIGVSSINSVIEYFKENQMQTSHLKLGVEDGFMKNVFLEPMDDYNDKIVLNGLEVRGKYLLCFSKIIDSLSSENNITNFKNYGDNLLAEFRQGRLFSIGVKASLLLILSVLLINFLVFNHYFKKAEQLKELSDVNDANKQKLTLLKSKVEAKEKRVEAILSSVNSRTSYILDDIASTIPETLLLNGIQFQPLLKGIRPTKHIELDKNVVLVKGVSYDSDAFSQWIDVLERRKWVNGVETLDYDYNDTKSSVFTVKIGVNE